ncbi:hypothetical protein LTR70_007592 [Exophiala xenobiotica]|uniref:Methyltransferase type 11 domain-containing protein n=1 Tax=Lithohypha guttulata TaxID=1690604 RepID=A0ABR0K0A6_9EURO|nr:hypothetical protein LTR24_008949 [Lithohypha guttulata]KAK5313519.1 hypothetical protein LTR70_007592 [Exophiala xenobiotica]
MPSTETCTQSPSTNPYYKRAYALSNVESARKFYDEWADRYDNDTVADGYTGPTESVKAIVQYIGADNMPNATFLDAGCGTGLVGVLLAREGASTIDGLDLSPGMLKVARKTGIYKCLGESDLSKPMDKQDESYDVVACVGTLTHGHVGPQALPEFVRVIKPGGLVVATVIEDIWESHGYKAEVEHLATSKQVDVLHSDTVGYRTSANLGAKLLVMKKL